MEKKIITIPFSFALGQAANAAITISKKLNEIAKFNKCRQFGIAINSDGGVPINAQLEPVSGRPLISSVSTKYLEVNAGVKPDDRLLTVEFDVTSEIVNVIFTPTANTTSVFSGQAIFVLTTQ